MQRTRVCAGTQVGSSLGGCLREISRKLLLQCRVVCHSIVQRICKVAALVCVRLSILQELDATTPASSSRAPSWISILLLDVFGQTLQYICFLSALPLTT